MIARISFVHDGLVLSNVDVDSVVHIALARDQIECRYYTDDVAGLIRTDISSAENASKSSGRSSMTNVHDDDYFLGMMIILGVNLMGAAFLI